MNCRAAEEMVTRYINHTLSTREMEEFLDHVQNCSSCYEELETYYIVHKAILQLNEEESDQNLDLRQLLDQELKRSRRSVRNKKAGRRLTVVLTGVLVVLLMICLIFVTTGTGTLL